MSKTEDNKAIVGRWFTDFWGATCNLAIVDELAAPDMLLQYSLHAPRRGHDDIKAFMIGFREVFLTSASRVLPTSSPRATMWSAAGKVGERIPGQPSVTFSSAHCRRQPAGKCTSPERPCFACKMARSQKRSAWTMA
jgi:hypothetical protein